ncbi:hypothetical protein BDV12DRAFT_96129 [Aspergillus spectabilis]
MGPTNRHILAFVFFEILDRSQPWPDVSCTILALGQQGGNASGTFFSLSILIYSYLFAHLFLLICESCTDRHTTWRWLVTGVVEQDGWRTISK